MNLPDEKDMPDYVTFEEFAQLLRDYGVDPHATGDNIRYRARTDPEWPIGFPGEGKKYEYRRVSNARLLPPWPAMQHWQGYLQAGRRGPDKKPRQRREDAQ